MLLDFTLYNMEKNTGILPSIGPSLISSQAPSGAAEGGERPQGGDEGAGLENTAAVTAWRGLALGAADDGLAQVVLRGAVGGGAAVDVVAAAEGAWRHRNENMNNKIT